MYLLYSGNIVGIAFIVKRLTPAQKTAMVTGWVRVEGSKFVGSKWFCWVRRTVLGRVGPTNTNAKTTHRPPTFQCEAMRDSVNS